MAQPPPPIQLSDDSRRPSKALVIGINYLAWSGKPLPSSASCRNAINYLTRIGVPADNMHVLTDEADSWKPTKQAILDEMDWLIAGAKEGDVLFFHFTGHGVELLPPAENPMGRPSMKAICPVDFYTTFKNHAKLTPAPEKTLNPKISAVNGITGDDFRKKFEHLEALKVNLTVIYDCCHSGGAMRDTSGTNPFGGLPPVNYPMENSRNIGDKFYGKGEISPSYVFGLTASEGWEKAWEVNSRIAPPQSALSYYLYGVLQTMSQATYNDIIYAVGNAIWANQVVKQTPMLMVFPENKRQAKWLVTLDPIKNPLVRGLGGGEEQRGIDDGATEQVQRVVNLYTQIAANSDLQNLRQQNRGLFDTLLKHAVPFALNAAQSAVQSFAQTRDVGSDVAVQRHLPTAINFANQVITIPEVQERGFFDKIFSIGMPLVLNTAQTLLGAKRGLNGKDDEQRGFFDAIVGQLPTTVFNVLSDSTGRQRDVGDRGFFDVLKKIAPIVLNVAQAAVGSLQGQRSLDFAPTDRGFFNKIKKLVKKVVNNPMIKKIGGAALNMGMGFVQNAISGPQQGPPPSADQNESQVRGFFGSMLQTLTPLAMGALQGAISRIGSKRDFAVVPAERGIFDIIAKTLPAVIQIAQTAFSQRRGVGANEDEAAYLQRVLATSSERLIAAAREQAASGSDRDILGSVVGDLL